MGSQYCQAIQFFKELYFTRMDQLVASMSDITPENFHGVRDIRKANPLTFPKSWIHSGLEIILTD